MIYNIIINAKTQRRDMDKSKLELIEKIKKETRERSLQTINAFKDFESMDNTSLLTIANIIESYKKEKEELGEE